MKIQENVQKIREGIIAAAKKSGRKPEEITLVGVTKNANNEQIEALLAAGVTHLGESKVQDFLPKYEFFTSETAPTWHFIGHLQSNKVKHIVGKAAAIHSVDSLRLVEEIDKRSALIGQKTDIMIEINVAKEKSKFGIFPEDAGIFAEKLSLYPSICLKGLMCIAPFVENAEENRAFFEKMYNLRVDIIRKSLYNTAHLELSMGMTQDWAVAIEEGATIIRIGTALFGE